MIWKALSADFSVATQLDLKDVAAAKRAGFRTIVNYRSDGEEPDQHASARFEAEACRVGLEYHHIPVVPGRFRNSQIVAFCFVMGSCEKPVLGFCKSGGRAASLWALSLAGSMPAADLLRLAAAAGYDLESLLPRIQARARLVR